MDILRSYFNEKAASWDEIVAEKDVSKLERMAERLDIRSGAKVLDVGTGTGVFIPFLLSKVGNGGQILALDFAEEMLKISCTKRIRGEIYHLHAAVTHIPTRDEFFDVIVCYSSFPHFQDKKRACAEMNRVTRAGGRLLICHTSSRIVINEIHRQIPSVARDTIPDAGEMSYLLSSNGFTDIEIDDGDKSYLVRARKPE